MLTTASVARIALRGLLFLLLANCVAAQGKMVDSRPAGSDVNSLNA